MTTLALGRPGTIEWVDLAGRVPDAMRQFYASVLGWTYRTTATPLGTYWTAMAGGHRAAGLMCRPTQGRPATWTVFVRVSSCTGALEAIDSGPGGTVSSEPYSIPGGAVVAVATDPTGGTIAVAEGDPAAGEPPMRRSQRGTVAHVQLMAPDPLQAAGFYDAVFGWRALPERRDGCATFRMDGTDVGALRPAEMLRGDGAGPSTSRWIVYFHVGDVAGATARAVSAGGAVARWPQQHTNGVGPISFAVLRDPWGTLFGLLERHESHGPTA